MARRCAVASKEVMGVCLVEMENVMGGGGSTMGDACRPSCRLSWAAGHDERMESTEVCP